MATKVVVILLAKAAILCLIFNCAITRQLGCQNVGKTTDNIDGGWTQRLQNFMENNAGKRDNDRSQLMLDVVRCKMDPKPEVPLEKSGVDNFFFFLKAFFRKFDIEAAYFVFHDNSTSTKSEQRRI